MSFLVAAVFVNFFDEFETNRQFIFLAILFTPDRHAWEFWI
jgi:hypothetical protein